MKLLRIFVYVILSIIPVLLSGMLALLGIIMGGIESWTKTGRFEIPEFIKNDIKQFPCCTTIKTVREIWKS